MTKQATLLDDAEIEDGSVIEPTSMVPATNPMQILDKAVIAGMPVETIEKLMELQERWDANRAKEAYAESMRECQQELPVVVKDAKGHNSRYARLETVLADIRPVYTMHGFSLSFGVEETEKENILRVYCDCLHCHGHRERIACNFPIDTTGNKNSVQSIGSTMSYARRYLTLLVFNISIAEEDNDGGGSLETITPEQIARLNGLMANIQPVAEPGENILDKILAFGGVDSLEEFPAHLYDKALSKLTATAKAKGVL